MKAYTIECPGRLVAGIALANGAVSLGVNPGTGRPVTALVDEGATVEAGRLVEAPGRGALLLVRDHAGVFGSWYIRGANPDERWDAMAAAELIPNALDRILAAERVRALHPQRAPTGWYEFARGASGPSPENARLRVDIYGYLEEGASFEIRRRGRLEGSPAVLHVSCAAGAVCVADPVAEAEARRARPGGRP